jgi:hypothetical protein
MRKYFISLLVICICGLCFATTKEEQIQKGIAYHDSAQVNGKEDVLLCQELLFPYIEKDMIARAYYGSAVTIEASFYENTDPIKALSLLEKGSAFIDSAVKADTNNEVLRFLRIVNGISVSQNSPLKRYGVIKNDINWFENREIDFSAEQNAQLYYSIALYYLAANDIDSALYALDDCLATDSSCEWVEKAKDLLWRYEE